MSGVFKGDKRMVIDLDKPIYYSAENYSALTENDVVSEKDGLMTLRPTLMECDIISDNSSRYGLGHVKRSLDESIFFQRRFRANNLYGEYEHPMRDSSLERIFHIEPTRYAWFIEDYWFEKNIVKGVCHLADPLGVQILQPNMKRFGSNVASSLRSITEHIIEKQDPTSGRKYKDKVYPIKFITFDVVTLPGFEESRLMPTADFAAIKNNRRAVSTEAIGSGELVQVNTSKIVDEIKSLAQRGEESLAVIQDLYGIDIKDSKVDFVNNGRVVISLENGSSFNLPVDDYFLNELV